MKKVLFAMMLLASTTIQAQEKMKIVLTDGSTQEFEVKNIQRFYFEGQNVTLTTGSASSVTSNSATLSYTVSGITASIPTGIIVSTSSSLTFENYQKRGYKSATTEDGTYSVSIDGLSASTTYYYRAYAKVDNDYVYGNVRSFTTTSSSVVSGIYQEPYTNWGASISMTKSFMSGYTLYQEQTNLLAYLGNGKELLIMYAFNSGKLYNSVVVVPLDNATQAQLDAQLQSRNYIFATESEGALVYLSADMKTVTILQYDSEVSAYYVYYYDYDWFMSSSPEMSLDTIVLQNSRHAAASRVIQKNDAVKSLLKLK